MTHNKTSMVPNISGVSENQGDPPIPARILAQRVEYEDLVRAAQSVVIESPEGEAEVSRMLYEVKERAEELDKQQREATEPMMLALERVRGWFRPSKVALNAMEIALKGAISAYRQHLAADRERARLAAAAARTAEDTKAALAKLEAAQPRATPGIRVSKVWTFDVVDVSKVPHEFLIVNTPAIRKAIHAGAREISGVRIYQKEQIASAG